MLPRGPFRFKRTTLITAGSVAFLVGLAAARFGWTIPLVIVSVATGIVFAAARHRNWQTLAGIVAFGLLLGCWRGGVYMQRIAPYKNLYGQKVIMEVTASADAAYSFPSKRTRQKLPSPIQ